MDAERCNNCCCCCCFFHHTLSENFSLRGGISFPCMLPEPLRTPPPQLHAPNSYQLLPSHLVRTGEMVTAVPPTMTPELAPTMSLEGNT
jgi:hypothetical protein